LTVSAGRPEIASRVARHVSAAATSSGEKFGCFARRSAAAPATCGHAIDVPDLVPVDVSESVVAAVIDDPGAWMSTHDPWLENDDSASVRVVEPTVIASGADAGL